MPGAPELQRVAILGHEIADDPACGCNPRREPATPLPKLTGGRVGRREQDGAGDDEDDATHGDDLRSGGRPKVPSVPQAGIKLARSAPDRGRVRARTTGRPWRPSNRVEGTRLALRGAPRGGPVTSSACPRSGLERGRQSPSVPPMCPSSPPS